MAGVLYNHVARIKGLQPAKVKSLYPGTIVKFRYSGSKVFDKTPMVLVLWNDYIEYKIHGINLNYLTEFEIKILFKELMEVKGNTLTVEDQSEKYDDTLPYRNLLKDPYTRIKLPTYKENRGGNPLSKSQALTQMKTLYTKHLKKIIKKHDMYRSYFDNKIREPKVVTYDIEGLLK
tara:strand:+ start:3556 stop:4083 length:528 start_codon:yes stop_codon:yes gene_type:complete